MPLFQVQDNDRPMYVVADDFQDAFSKWEKVIREENGGEVGELPLGIMYICADVDLIADKINAA